MFVIFELKLELTCFNSHGQSLKCALNILYVQKKLNIDSFTRIHKYVSGVLQLNAMVSTTSECTHELYVDVQTLYDKHALAHYLDSVAFGKTMQIDGQSPR